MSGPGDAVPTPVAAATRGRCSGGCGTTYALVRDTVGDLTIISAARTQLNVRTGEEVAGTRRVLQPAELNQWITEALRRQLGGGFLYEADECPAGCYCQTFGTATTRVETVRIPARTRMQEPKLKIHTPHDFGALEELVESVRAGRIVAVDANSQPYRFDPELDTIGSTFMNCCGQIIVEMEVMNLFLYELEFEARLELSIWAGECRSLPLQGEVV